MTASEGLPHPFIRPVRHGAAPLVSPGALHELLEGTDPPLLLDVRPPRERSFSHLPDRSFHSALRASHSLPGARCGQTHRRLLPVRGGVPAGRGIPPTEGLPVRRGPRGRPRRVLPIGRPDYPALPGPRSDRDRPAPAVPPSRDRLSRVPHRRSGRAGGHPGRPRPGCEPLPRPALRGRVEVARHHRDPHARGPSRGPFDPPRTHGRADLPEPEVTRPVPASRPRRGRRDSRSGAGRSRRSRPPATPGIT